MAPDERLAAAWFGLGNALLRQANGDPQMIDEAIRSYRVAIHKSNEQTPWRKSARHNLELAQMMALDAPPPPKPIEVKPKQKNGDGKSDDKGEKKKDNVLVPIDPSGDLKPQDSNQLPKDGKSKSLASGGRLVVLPDRDVIIPLTPQQTLATLEQQAERIAGARREQRHPPGPAQLWTKDW